MAYYRKKPVIVQAEEFDPDHRPLPFDGHSVCCFDGEKWFIETLEGQMLLTPGDYVIKGVKGEYYPCKPDIFEATYEWFAADVSR